MVEVESPLNILELKPDLVGESYRLAIEEGGAGGAHVIMSVYHIPPRTFRGAGAGTGLPLPRVSEVRGLFETKCIRGPGVGRLWARAAWRPCGPGCVATLGE